MVSTRRSNKKKAQQAEGEVAAEKAAAAAATSTTTTTSTPSSPPPEPKNEGRLSAREKRRRQREEMRSKSTGIGIPISTKSLEEGPNKKIVFEDADEDDATNEMIVTSESTQENPLRMVTQSGQDSCSDVGNDDDDDDDAVEEMTSNVARMVAQKQREQELANIRAAEFLNKKRKRKNRSLEQPWKPDDEEDNEELDVSFFEQLDAEKEQERSSRRKKKIKQPVGRHTTFVVKDEDVQLSKHHRVNQNIQVVVLKDPDQSSRFPLPSGDAFKASDAAMVFSRARLNDGSDVVTEKQKQKAKKTGKKVVDNATWKRSKKMNRLLLPGAKSSRRKGQIEAPSFVFKM